MGQTVRHVGRLSVAHALWYARQVAEAIGELHRNEWRHGDVKPDNIMVAAGGHATLFDLGFASHPRVAPLTADQLLHGTLAYAAPELFTSRCSAGPASDVYSLGVSLYELITGNLPFNYAKSSRMAEAHLREIPPSPRTHLPQLPRSICQLLQRMLAKDRARRPYFQDELVCQLTRLEIEVLGLRVL